MLNSPSPKGTGCFIMFRRIVPSRLTTCYLILHIITSFHRVRFTKWESKNH